MRRVYFDNSATTPVLPEVLEAMRPYFAEHFGNASSIHHHGQETRAAVESAREAVGALVGCRAAEVVFTSGGTEADNQAIFGVVQANAGAAGSKKSAAVHKHIITSAIEHEAVLNSCRAKTDRWIQRLLATKPRLVVAVALANKMARIAWAVMVRQTRFRQALVVA